MSSPIVADLFDLAAVKVSRYDYDPRLERAEVRFKVQSMKTKNYKYYSTVVAVTPAMKSGASGSVAEAVTAAAWNDVYVDQGAKIVSFVEAETKTPGANSAYVVPSVLPPSWVTESALGDFQVGNGLNVQLRARLAATYVVATGELPIGVELNALTGELTGTPGAAGAYTFAVDAFGAAESLRTRREFTLVAADPPAWVTEAIPDATVGAPVSAQLIAADATHFSVSAGVPPGLQLSVGGLMSGIPTATGAYSFTVSAALSPPGAPGRLSSDRTFAFGVGALPLWQTASALEAAPTGVAFSRNLVATNAVSYSLFAGALPTGSTLSPAGVLSGTPTEAGAYLFTVKAASAADSIFSTRAFSVRIETPPTWVTPPALTPRATGSIISLQLNATLAYSYAMAGGGLPPGLTLSPATGAIAGTATTPGDYAFVVRAFSPAPAIHVDRAFSLQVATTPVWTTTAIPDAALGASYSTQLDATSAVYYSVASGRLPAGLSLNSGGLLSGEPTEDGTFTASIKASSVTSAVFATKTFSFGVQQKPEFFTNTPLAEAQLGVAQSRTFNAANAVAYTLASGALPPGMTLSTAGAFYGTPSAAGSFSFVVKATSPSAGIFATKSFAMIVAAKPTWSTPGALQNAATGMPLSYTLSATNAVKYSLVSGAVPGGVALSEFGLLEGIPATAGSYSFTVSAVSAGVSIFTQRAFTVLVADTPVWTTPAIPAATKDAPYSFQLGASAAVSYSILSGSLPSGITMTDGLLSGSAATESSNSFVVRATSAAFNVYADQAFSMLVAVKPAWATGETLSGVASDEPMSLQLNASSTVAYTATSALPPGVALSSSGVLSGAPTTPSSASFTIRATSVAPNVWTDRVFSMLIVSRPAWGTSQQLGDVLLGAPQSTQLQASAATGYVVQSGSATGGCALSGAGLLSGTTNAAGVFSFVVRASTQTPDVYADRTFVQAVAPYPVWVSGSDVDVPVNESVGRQLSATDGASYAVVAGSLPQGLVLSSAGLLHGTTSSAGTFLVTVRATSIAASFYTDKVFNVRGAVVPTWTTSPIVPATVLDTAMAPIRMAASSAVSFSVVSGTLPTGVTLIAGELSGTPTSQGTSTFTVRASTSVAAVYSDLTFSFGVFKTPTFVTPPRLADTETRDAMSLQLVANDANTFAVVSGSLCPGLALSPAGVLSGTPTESGDTSFTVRAGTPAATIYADRTFQLKIAARPTWVTPPTLADVNTHSVVMVQLQADDAATYTVAAGALPPGLSMSSFGIIAGAASEPGAYNFTARAAGVSSAVYADRVFNIRVATTPSWVTATLADALVGAPMSVQLEATDASSYSATTALPPGLSLNPFGLLAGTPSPSWSGSFTIRATSTAAAFYSDRVFSFRAAARPEWTSTTIPDAQKGVALSVQLSANGASRYSVVSGTVCPGLSVSDIGLLSGTPTTDGPYAFSVRAFSSSATIYADRAFAILVESTPSWITDATLPDVAMDEPCGLQLVAVDVDVFSLRSGALPAGVTMTTAGHLSGTPTVAGAHSFTVRAESTSSSMYVERTFALFVAARPAWVTPPVIPPAVPSVPWTFQLEAAAADGGYSIVSTSEALSANVREDVDDSGLLVVPYPQLGVRTFVARAFGASYSIYADREFTIRFHVLPIWTTPPRLVLDYGGTSVAMQLLASDAATFSLDTGVLPPGTSLSPAGLVSGVPSAKGTFVFAVVAAGADPAFHSSQTFTAVVESEPEWVTASPLAALERGLYASVPLIANDAASYSVASGAAPAGMTVTADGSLEGTPTTEGSTDVAVRASSGSGEKTADRTFTVPVHVRPTWVTDAALPDATTSVEYSEFLVATDGESYGTTDALPDGMSLSAAGVLSGTPTTPGSYSFTVLATSDLSATRQFNLSVA
jgi:hypothetical protein